MVVRDQQTVILLVPYGPRFYFFGPVRSTDNRWTTKTLNFSLDNPISSWSYCSPFSCFEVQSFPGCTIFCERGLTKTVLVRVGPKFLKIF